MAMLSHSYFPLQVPDDQRLVYPWIGTLTLLGRLLVLCRLFRMHLWHHQGYLLKSVRVGGILITIYAKHWDLWKKSLRTRV